MIPLPRPDLRKAGRDLLLALSSQLFYKVAGYVVIVVLTRHLAKDSMGQFFFAASLAGSLVLFTELGMSSHLVRETARRPARAVDRLSDVLSARLPLLAAYLVALVAVAAIARPELLQIVLLTGLYVGLEDFYLSIGAVFVGLKRVKYNVATGVSSKGLLVVLALLVARRSGDLRAILACYVVVDLVLVAVAWWIARRKVGRVRASFRPGLLRGLVPASLPFFGLSVLAILHFNVDTLMLGFLRGYETVAGYQAGFKLLEASQALSRPAAMIFFPLCAELAARRGWRELASLHRWLALGAVAVGGLMAAVAAVGAGWAIPSLFGPRYASTAGVVRILYLGVPGLYVSAVSMLVALALGREWRALRISLACVALNAGLNAVAIPLAGATGAAWSTVVSQSALAVWLVAANARALSAAEVPARLASAPTEVDGPALV